MVFRSDAIATERGPVAPSRLHRCRRCDSRRWSLVERGARLRAGCLGCGLIIEDFLSDAQPAASIAGATDIAMLESDASTIAWIAHAGLAASRPEGTPTRESLSRAVRIGVDAVELDVCVTRDQQLVLRHDVRLPNRRRVRDLSLEQLRRWRPETLTLGEGVDEIAGRTAVLLDAKDREATVPLGRWLRRRRQREEMIVCSSSPAVLLHLREEAPRIERWHSWPAISSSRAPAVAGVVRSLARTWISGRGGAVVGELGRAATAAIESPRAAAWHVVGSPWRRELPSLIEQMTAEVNAAGMTVDHRLVSPELCEAARFRGLRLVAWTINASDHLHRAIASGVRTITTDRVVEMRLSAEGLTPAP